MKIFLLPFVLISITSANMERAVLDHLNKYYPVTDAEYVCDFSRINTSRIPESDSVAVDGYGKENPRGQVVVYFSYFNNGKRVFKTNGTVRVGLLKRTLISTAPIKSGAPFTAENLKYETRDIASSDGNLFSHKEELIGMVASKFIPAGRVITRSDSKKAPLVTRGDMVRILYNRGALSLRVDGVARQDGATGEKIKIMNIDTRKIIYATIVDSTTVAVASREGI